MLKKHFTEDSTVGDFAEDPELFRLLKPLLDSCAHVHEKKDKAVEKGDAVSQEMMDATFNTSPLRSVFGFGEGDFDHEKVAEIIHAAQEYVDTKKS